MIYRFVEWIQETIGNLEGQPMKTEIQVSCNRKMLLLALKNMIFMNKQVPISSTIYVNSSDPCVPNPCGVNAICWNSGLIEFIKKLDEVIL